MKKSLVYISLLLILLSCQDEKQDAAYQTAKELQSIPLAKQYTNNCLTMRCVADGQLLTSRIYKNKGQYYPAMIHINRALELFKKQKRIDKLISTHLLIGSIYYKIIE